MIAITVRNNGRRHGFWRYLGDLSEEILRAGHRLLGINNDDARLADNDGAVAARATKPHPHIGIQHFHRNRGRRLLLSLRGYRQYAAQNQGEPKAKSLYL